METSAKTGESIEELFIEIGKYYALVFQKLTYNECSIGEDACPRAGVKAFPTSTEVGGIFWSSKSFLERQYLVYWSHSYSMVNWLSGDLPQETFLKPNFLQPLQRRKCPFRR